MLIEDTILYSVSEPEKSLIVIIIRITNPAIYISPEIIPRRLIGLKPSCRTRDMLLMLTAIANISSIGHEITAKFIP